MIHLTGFQVAIVVISLVNLILVTICAIISVYALVGVLALKNSTHTMVPVSTDDFFKDAPQDKSFEDFRSKEVDELAKEMPEFFEQDEKGKKKFVF